MTSRLPGEVKGGFESLNQRWHDGLRSPEFLVLGLERELRFLEFPDLGFERDRELEPIQNALISAGVPCGQGAMSCNEAPLVVNPEDFARARAIAIETVIRNSLTVRLYKSPSGWSSLLEVWEEGRKTREEPHKLYPLSDETIRSSNAWSQTQKAQTK